MSSGVCPCFPQGVAQVDGLRVESDPQVSQFVLGEPAGRKVFPGAGGRLLPRGLALPQAALAQRDDGLQHGAAGLPPPREILFLLRRLAFRERDAGELGQVADGVDEILPARGEGRVAGQPPAVLERPAADVAQRTAPLEGFQVDVEGRAGFARMPRTSAARLV